MQDILCENEKGAVEDLKESPTGHAENLVATCEGPPW